MTSSGAALLPHPEAHIMLERISVDEWHLQRLGGDRSDVVRGHLNSLVIPYFQRLDAREAETR